MLAFLLFVLNSYADEGMWLPCLLGKEKIADMQKKGLRLSAKEIYDINNASLKDAVVRFGGGCSAEIISNDGLLITNHHCGYDQIRSHSTIEHDYLTNGFVANNRNEELPNPGLVVEFLEYMDDVTNLVNKGIKKGMSKNEIDSIRNINIGQIKKNALSDRKSCKASIDPFYYGNQWYLFVFKVYKDVRLVLAPPSSIGKFGGDTDNWMWPRHTGDFSVFRIYADENNEPADFSDNNVPFHPRKSFTISTKGVSEGDFTFIYGFPGSTRRYLHSEGVRYIAEKGDPAKIMLRTVRLDVMNKYQSQDPAIRIMYASKNVRTSNAWKKWQGEMLGLNRLRTVEKKQNLEKEFENWASGTEFDGVTLKLKSLYDSLMPWNFAYDYYNEAPCAIEILKFAHQFQNNKPVVEDINSFYKDYYKEIDSTSAIKLVSLWKSALPSAMLINEPSSIKEVFESSRLFDKDYVLSASAEELKNDIAVKYSSALFDKLSIIKDNYKLWLSRIDETYGLYMRGLMKKNKSGVFFPDANLTLRVAYGNIAGYSPKDAVYYKSQSTLDGVMQKDNPDIYDYNIPDNLRKLYSAKDFGRWDVNGTVPVAFIATNHTTGGNSGSPVLNGDGQLIGINFDRVWEGTMSDIEFDPSVCRNISLDIRYALFLIDKLMGAGYLIDEMNLD